MAFAKTGLAVTPPTSLRVGMEKEGKVWDGEEWILPEDWRKRQSRQEQPSLQPVARLSE